MALNQEKLESEYKKWLKAWRSGEDTETHAGGGWTNRWVEAARASAYAAGHIDAILYPLLLVAVIVLALR